VLPIRFPNQAGQTPVRPADDPGLNYFVVVVSPVELRAVAGDHVFAAARLFLP
jgi:hypothetical protein